MTTDGTNLRKVATATKLVQGQQMGDEKALFTVFS